MKLSFKRSVLSIIVLLTLTFSLTCVIPVSAKGQGNSPLAQHLNPDGTLNLSSGYTGSLDIRSYSVSMDPKRGPIFRPLMSVGIWTGLNTGLNNIVHAVAVSGTNVIVGGDFINAGGDGNADYIAKWDGTSWSALTTTPLNNIVLSIAVNNTSIYAGGSFTDAGGNTNADYIALWNGTNWSALTTTPLTGSVYTIYANSTDVYIGGWYIGAGANANYIAKLNGTTWSALGTGVNSGVYAITVSGTDVYAGGWFTNAGGNANADYIAKWNGSSWSALGTVPLNNYVYALATSGTDVIVGGSFVNAGANTNADYIAKWNGTSWSALGTTPLNNTVNTILTNGTNIYAGGWFTDASGHANADYAARWSGISWTPLGTTSLGTVVNAIAISGTDVYVAGEFTNAGGNGNADYIAIAKPAITTQLSSNGAQDGCVLESSETSKLGSLFNSTASIFKVGDNVGRRQYRGILSFSTGGSIPDNATIASVILKVKIQEVVGGGNPVAIFGGFRADIKNGTYDASGLEITDFQAATSRTIDPGKPTLSNNVYSLNLSNGRASINKFAVYSGLTQIRLRFLIDDNNDSVNNYLALYSGNTSVAADRPQLVITYTVP